MADEVEELAGLIRQMASILRAVDEKTWSAEMAKCAEWIGNKDFYGVERFLGNFAGQGSFNDIVIHPMNQHKILPERVNEINQEMHRLLDQSHQLAKKLKSEYYS